MLIFNSTDVESPDTFWVTSQVNTNIKITKNSNKLNQQKLTKINNQKSNKKILKYKNSNNIDLNINEKTKKVKKNFRTNR